MNISLNRNDLSKLKPTSVADILSLLGLNVGYQSSDEFEVLPFGNPVDLSLNQIQHFMETVSPPVAQGLRYIAENGPNVLADEIIENTDLNGTNGFQGATTKRARNVTGLDGVTLLSWDDWNDEQYGDNCGMYGVTPVTFDSLRRFFGI